MPVLVAYASRHGSTAGVAERIAAVLTGHGVETSLRSVGELTDIDGYNAVVFGSPVYSQAWLPEGERFVRDKLETLSARPVWLFSVGTFGDHKRLIGPLMKREPKGIGAIREMVQARDYRVFAGVIDKHQWPFVSRLFFWSLGGRLGDNRDWASIEAWAAGIAQSLSAPAA